MPDKHEQDWIADDAFWSEAWNDMETRLDRKQRRAPLLLWLLPLAALLVAVVWRSVGNDAARVTNAPIAEEKAEERILPAAAPPKMILERGDVQADSRPARPDARPTRTNVPAVVDTVSVIALEPIATLSDDPTVAPIPSLSFTVDVSEGELRVGEVNTTTATTAKFSPPTPATFSYVAAFTNYFPGGGAGLGLAAGRTFYLREGRNFLDARLGFIHNQPEVSSRSLSESNSLSSDFNAGQPPETGGGFTTDFTQSEAYDRLQRDDVIDISYQSAELSLLAGRRMGRFSVAAGGGLGYVLGGRGPQLTELPASDPLVTQGQRNTAYRYTGNRGLMDTSVRRFQTLARLEAGYALPGRWSFGLAYTRRLSSFYRELPLSPSRDRLEAGITFRLGR